MPAEKSLYTKWLKATVDQHSLTKWIDAKVANEMGTARGLNGVEHYHSRASTAKLNRAEI
jgi:hypothetical protein